MQTQRREFLKLTTAGAAGLALVKGKPAFAAWPASGKQEINPDISNMRVVACNDSTMMKSKPSAMTFDAENAAVDTARVHADMDAMAMALAEAATAEEAWKVIFRSSRPWPSTRVAIKINVVEARNMARLAVIERFCKLFVGFGVPASNIIIFDGNAQFSSAISNYTSHFSTTDATKIPGVVSKVNDALGGTTNAKLADGSSAQCTADIANGKIDILINIANNKGHTLHGGSTLCMKNHFGTFAPNHNNLAGYVLNINKSDAIIGGDPVRQQLCFVDSLIANKAQNSGSPEAMPCYLIMGTFGPAVDYLTVKKVREEVMKAAHDATTVNNFVTSFGYSTSDPQWVLVPPAMATPDAGAKGAGGAVGGRDAGSADPGTGGALSRRDAGRASVGGAGGSAGGAGAGGTSASGGRGGSVGAGGSGSGGSKIVSSVGSGGASGSGGDAGSGGTSASGGGGSRPASSATGSGGARGGSATGAKSGCGIGGAGRRSGGMGVALAFGALIGGQLRRLLVRRATLAESAGPADESNPEGRPSGSAEAGQPARER